MTGAREHSGKARRLALLLIACALLFRIAVPAGWMPQANANGVTLGWCSGANHVAPAEARALLDTALGKGKAPEHTSTDQPCAFAAAAQPIAAPGNPLPELAPMPAPRAAPQAPLAVLPGRGLAAPPPRSTGPPRLT